MWIFHLKNWGLATQYMIIYCIHRTVFICIIFNKYWIPGWVLPYFGMVGRFCGDDPVFGIFIPFGSLMYTSTQSD